MMGMLHHGRAVIKPHRGYICRDCDIMVTIRKEIPDGIEDILNNCEECDSRNITITIGSVTHHKHDKSMTMAQKRAHPAMLGTHSYRRGE